MIDVITYMRKEDKMSSKVISDYNVEVASIAINAALKFNRPDFTVFIDFSGHVNEMRISWHCGGWSDNKEKTGEVSLYIDKKIPKEVFDRMIDDLQSASDNNQTLKEEASKRTEAKERREYARLQKKYA